MREATGKSAQSRRFRYGLYGFVSDRGLNPKRVTNEDSFLVLEEVPLFAVADGVGGQNAGEVASKVAVEILKNQFMKKKIPAEKLPFLDQVICYANRYLYDMAVDDEVLSGMATTLALVLVERKRVTLSHVGDSRIYRFTGGTLHRETKDHSLAEDRRYSAPHDGEPVNRNIITRALGVEPEVEPETRTIPLPADTAFLLCTDGITRHVSDEEMAEILRTEGDPQAACDVLKQICYERGAKDNLTAIVVKMDPQARFSGAHGRNSAETGTGTGTGAGGRSGVARFQIELQDPSEAGPAEGAAARHSREFAGQMPRADAPASAVPSWCRRVLIPLVLALAIVGAFFVGFNVNTVLSPTAPGVNTDEAGTPAHKALEEGRRAFEAGRYAEARDAFARAVSLNPDVAAYYHWLGEAQLALKEYLPGAESFWRAASLSGLSDDYLHAAMAYQAAGAKEKAAEALAASITAKR